MTQTKLIKRIKVVGLVKIALVAAIYIITTIAFGDLSYGPIQFRFSELLNFLAFIDPLYIIGLTLGCAISNFFSFGLIDVIVGSLATLISTYLMYKTKNIFIASLWPVMNCIFVATELYLLGLAPFWLSFGTIALGEFVVMTPIGVPIFKKLFKNKKLVEALIIDTENNTYRNKLQAI